LLFRQEIDFQLDMVRDSGDPVLNPGEPRFREIVARLVIGKQVLQERQLVNRMVNEVAEMFD
jgi:hypothetical protein